MILQSLKNCAACPMSYPEKGLEFGGAEDTTDSHLNQMHAAEANPSGPRHHQLWDTGIIPLPTPPRSDMEAALAFTRQQKKTLTQLGDALAHLAHLADQSRQPETPDHERQELNHHFHNRTSSLKAWAEGVTDGQPLFSPHDWTVDLTPHGNKLVIPGIYRSPQQAAFLQQTDLLSNRSATETHQRIMEILEWLAIDQALLAEIRSRLQFAANLSLISELVAP